MKTAVEWFNDEILIHLDFDQRLYLKDIFKQAKEMEKQQVIDAWEDGQNSFPTINAEKYYKEQFKNK